MNARSRLSIVVCHWLCQCLILGSSAGADDPADEYRLEEPVTDRRAFNVSIEVKAQGRFEFSVGDGKAVAQAVEVSGTYGYRERRLPGTGRDAEALRSLREYYSPESRIKVGEQLSVRGLRPEHRVLVAQGRRTGVQVYSPGGPLTALEREFLESPADSLAILGLLPPRAVSVGEKWAPEGWAGACLTRTEAVLKNDLSCRLNSVEDNRATVTFSGLVDGAIGGAATSIEVSGSYVYDLEERCVSRLELTQKDKRSVGSISPGMEITATAILQRAPSPVHGRLTDAFAETLALEPEARLLDVTIDLPGSLRIQCGRRWHLYQQNEQVTVLRLVEDGSFVCQCNIARIPTVAPGRHTPVDRFQGDIRIALGEKLREFASAEELPADGGRFLYRVTAVGESNGVPMHWIYYLCAAADGRQTSFVFTVESNLLEQLDGRDLELVRSLRFLAPPRPAERRAADRGQ